MMDFPHFKGACWLVKTRQGEEEEKKKPHWEKYFANTW